MKFKLGEFVRFVDENREGYITKIIDDTLVGVTGDDDFEIPVAITNLTHVHGHSDYEISEDLSEVVKEISPEEFKDKGVFLAVIPDANKGSIVHFYIVNETNFDLLSSVNTERGNIYKGEFSGIINSKSITKVFSAALPELDIWPKVIFRILPYTLQNIKPVKVIEVDYKFKAKDFSGSKKTIPFIKNQGWLIQLDEPELVIDPVKLKESFFKPVLENKKEVFKPALEVDLHIEKLRDDFQFLSKSEMLDIQMKEFQKNLDAAIANKYTQITFIHGVGNGTLKYELHKLISKHPQIKTFKDAHKEKFGYGATEIIFKL